MTGTAMHHDGAARCAECGLAYGSEAWADVLVPDEVWDRISDRPSGAGARPCNLAWMDQVVGDCRCSGVPVFVKQLGRCPIDGGGVVEGCGVRGERVDAWPEFVRFREMPHDLAGVMASGGGA